MSAMGNIAIGLQEGDHLPTFGEKIRCKCGARGCHAYLRVTRTGCDILFEVYPHHADHTVIYLDAQAGLGLSMLVGEAVDDIRHAK